MLSKATAQTIERVAGFFGKKEQQKAYEEPEVVALSMFLLLEKNFSELPVLSEIEMALWEDNLKEARKKMEQNK